VHCAQVGERENVLPLVSKAEERSHGVLPLSSHSRPFVAQEKSRHVFSLAAA
jgi:hypothetical protein